MTQGGLATQVEDVDMQAQTKVDQADGLDADGYRQVAVVTTIHVHLNRRRLQSTGGLWYSDNNTNNRCVYVSVCVPEYESVLVPVYVSVYVPLYVCLSENFGIFCIFKCPKGDCSTAKHSEIKVPKIDGSRERHCRLEKQEKLLKLLKV